MRKGGKQASFTSTSSQTQSSALKGFLPTPLTPSLWHQAILEVGQAADCDRNWRTRLPLNVILHNQRDALAASLWPISPAAADGLNSPRRAEMDLGRRLTQPGARSAGVACALGCRCGACFMSHQDDMIGTPDQFFDRVLLPNYLEFRRNSSCVRRVMNLAISCLSMRDWVEASSDPKYARCAVGSAGYHAQLVAREPMFERVAAIANASKHAKLNRGGWAGFSIERVHSDCFRVGDRCGTALRLVRVRFPGERGIAVDEMMARVVIMWAVEIGRNGQEVWRQIASESSGQL